jgi:DNA processing protein
MDTASLREWLAVSLAEQIGPIRFHALLSHFQHPRAVLAATASELASVGLPAAAIHALQQPDWPCVDATLTWAATQSNAHLLTLHDPQYPRLLRHIPDPPPVLFVLGDVTCLQQTQIAIVGSRHPSPAGEENAFAFAAELASAGIVITSGMALGIDAAAHRGALSVNGFTLAVAGTGLDRIYPAQHHALAHQISTQGALISEFPLGTQPSAGNFPRRNRLISGMSHGVLVVEAATQSGSLITAHHAIEQGREVFALPGSIHNTHAKGCHELIRQGAKLVESVAHILEELPPTFAENSTAYAMPAGHNEALTESPQEAALLAAMDDAPASVERIIQRSGLTADAVCSILLLLELQGKVQMTTAGQYCRVYLRTNDERKHSRCIDVPV